MEAALKKKWVAALRSGKYSRTTGQLRGRLFDGAVGHCCLGVLCDIVDPDGWARKDLTDESIALGTHRMGSGLINLPSLRGLGLLTRNSKSQHVGQAKLAKLNDQYGTTFEQIADLIEKEF